MIELGLNSAERQVAERQGKRSFSQDLAVIPPFSVCVLDRRDASAMNAVGELWARVYGSERGLLDLSDIRNAVEDRYHEHSDYIAIYADAQNEAQAKVMVATVRVVRDSRVELPIERFFALGPLKRYTHLVEPQRLIVDPAWRRRRFDGAPYGLSGMLFKAVVKRYLIETLNTTLVIDAFSDSRESPLHAFLQMGAKKFGCPFHDSELASDTPSIALLCTLLDITTQALSAERSRFARYLLMNDQGE
ncbi:N-acyl amino acid synthase FeeM domain-containing protein [Burkholderia multivorans]|uniref:N-acyl amino acid synthase FeeM domain-containing protein n=1 Tax=Burkholderia multivorans TaxID=87883 RepID=UPI0011B234BE|nr:GNAT family N-acyltransferase [Burkholderia multivorans]MDN7476833.1 GNAT family N-acyltransferase [Burkholderia multivorans]